MPSPIPYDSHLVLGSLVNPKAMDIIDEITNVETQTLVYKEELKTHIESRRSIEMHKSEVASLGALIDPQIMKPFNDELIRVDEQIKATSSRYVEARIKCETEVRTKRCQIPTLHRHFQMDSPIDYTKTDIKLMPLASESIRMDFQYFSQDVNNQDSTAFASTISNYVAKATSLICGSMASEMASLTNRQIADQTSKHKISGTLVFSVSCTHKNASVFAPMVLDVDKTVLLWNQTFRDDRFDPANVNVNSITGLGEINTTTKNTSNNKLTFISGMTYGSSFVGMVHILNTASTEVHEDMTGIAKNLHTQYNIVSPCKNESCNETHHGVTRVADDLRHLLSSQNISCHVTMACMGAIPSIVSSNVKIGVEKFVNFDPKSSIEALQKMQKSGGAKSALSTLAEIDDGYNKILDINSMMRAFEDYRENVRKGTSGGVPINYFTRDITKSSLAEMWNTKYCVHGRKVSN
ncbi:hypothetical protein QBC38DRAFT_404009 [Podospora fimiseda]|uniref:Uncharacterized protein n=1 Tax=Podospora fimiseda TaxID=252190 RepID=A0AAN6YNJ3_9PEZI|nr:hypothetical protein QBC38DRAFT_404009 [Podospora fimiseda]